MWWPICYVENMKFNLVPNRSWGTYIGWWLIIISDIWCWCLTDLSPTSKSCHQHIWSPTSVTNIDVNVVSGRREIQPRTWLAITLKNRCCNQKILWKFQFENSRISFKSIFVAHFFGILKIRKMETASKTENKADQTKQQVFYRLICLMVEIVFSWNLRLKNFINVFKIWKFWNLTHFKRKVTMKVISIIILLMIRPGKRLPSLDAVFIHCSDNLPVDWLTIF